MTGADALFIWACVFGGFGTITGLVAFVCGDHDLAVEIAKITSVLVGFFGILFGLSIYFF